MAFGANIPGQVNQIFKIIPGQKIFNRGTVKKVHFMRYQTIRRGGKRRINQRMNLVSATQELGRNLTADKARGTGEQNFFHV